MSTYHTSSVKMSANNDKGGLGGLGHEQDDLTEEALDLHSALGVDTSLSKGMDVIYHSVSSVTNSGPIEFLIPRDEECCFILDQTRIFGHFVVTKGTNDKVLAADQVTLVNNFANNLFSQCEVYINGTQVCDLTTADSYPFKNFIQTELSYDYESKMCQLRSEGYFFEDSPDVISDVFTNFANKPSLTARRDLITDKKKVYFCARLGADIMYTDKYLPPNVDIKIKLIRNKPTWGVLHNIAGRDCNIHLKDLKLKMRKVMPTLQERQNYKLKLSREPCYIPFKSSQFKVSIIPSLVSSYTVTNVASGILPKQIIFAMIHGDAFSHDPKMNPFNFQTFKLNRFNVIKNGQNVFPKAFTPDFDNDDYMDLFRHMYDSVGFGISNHSCAITPTTFKGGRCFLVVDFTPDRCNSFHLHPDEKGKIDVELGFKTPAIHNIYLLSYAIFDSGIKIEETGQVIRSDQ